MGEHEKCREIMYRYVFLKKYLKFINYYKILKILRCISQIKNIFESCKIWIKKQK